MTSIHGHEVLAMMENHYYSDSQSLIKAIEERFGQDAKFHTCSASDMSASELVMFLQKRKKFKTVSDKGFTVNLDKICTH